MVWLVFFSIREYEAVYFSSLSNEYSLGIFIALFAALDDLGEYAMAQIGTYLNLGLITKSQQILLSFSACLWGRMVVFVMVAVSTIS